MIQLRPGVRELRTQVAGGLLVLMLVACLPLTSFAHAKLVRSQPKANDTLSQVPKLVELWFNEELEPSPGLNTVEVKDPTGTRFDRGEVTLSEGNKKAQVELGELGPGTYTVSWKAVAADQHAMHGTFTFSVATPNVTATTTPSTEQKSVNPSPPQPPNGHMPAMGSEGNQVDQIAWGQTLVRWLSYLAMMMLFGGFAFRSLVLVPSFRRALEGDTGQAMRVSERRVLLFSWISIAVLFISSLAALALQASTDFDKPLGDALSPTMLGRVLGTGYGRSWILQITSTVVIAVILLLLTHRIKRNNSSPYSGLWWAGLLTSAVLLIAPTWTGHAMASAKEFRLAVFTDWLHLLAGGFWVGGLFHLAMSWRPALESIPKQRRPLVLNHVIKHFTRIAMPSVVLLVLAGLYNTWAHIPRLQAFWMTDYGKALSLKLLLVALMLLLGAINNYHFGKRAARLVKREENLNDSEASKLERGFGRSVVFEAALGAVVLLVTAVLVFLTPARSHPAMTDSGTAQMTNQQR